MGSKVAGMRALSIQQPWASAIVLGHKPVENRTWKTSYRGPLLIHAGKQVDHFAMDWLFEGYPELMAALKLASPLPRGGIVGRATMTDCVTHHASPLFFGPYGFVFCDAEPLPFVPLRGKLGLFEVNWPATLEERPGKERPHG